MPTMGEGRGTAHAHNVRREGDSTRTHLHQVVEDPQPLRVLAGLDLRAGPGARAGGPGGAGA